MTRNSHHRAALDRLREMARLGHKGGDALEAALGWNSGVTGQATVVVSDTSIAGYALARESVIIFNDVMDTRRFTDAHLLRGHGVRSSLAARVCRQGKPWGVLTLHERERRDFSREEIAFVMGAATELAGIVGAEGRGPG